MAPKSKLRIKNTNSIKQRWKNNNVEEQQDSKPFEDRPRTINAYIAVISTYIQGSNYERARMAAATEGNSFPSKATYYRHQEVLISKIKNKYIDHINKIAGDILSEKKFDLSGDGKYPTTRDSMQCTYSCMDCVKNKVVNVNIVSKNEVNVSTNMLESNTARKCFDNIVDKYWKDSYSTSTSDNDNKSLNQAKKAGLVPERRFDPRHGFKCLSREFYKLTNSFEHEELIYLM
ncbi:hypothetical protein M9Y10_012049 [Tritrichomonas musculus]|uniref:Uncharacterized protein n=1 Tax=Tritrichomonas musculus TaxID=1915356 RepID=A0ABR2IE05_9EUKA